MNAVAGIKDYIAAFCVHKGADGIAGLCIVPSVSAQKDNLHLKPQYLSPIKVIIGKKMKKNS